MKIFWEAFKDASIDTIMVLPVLYLAYLLVSYFSHNDNEKYSKILHKTNKAGPVVGALLGSVPQCGFSSVMSSLFSKRIVTVGTLLAVFIATSDEALPLMISKPEFIPKLLLLMAIKLVYAILIGYLVDWTIRIITRKKPALNEYHDANENLSACEKSEEEIASEIHEHEEHDEHEHHHEHNHECHHAHEDKCGHTHSHSHCCATNIFLDALKHTVIIIAYVFVATLAINLIEGYVGLDGLTRFFAQNKYLQVLLASVIGLIPNCVASVFLTELYMSNILMFPALVAGLTASAGVGFIVLWTANRKNVKVNLAISFAQFGFALLIGFVLSFLPFW